MTRTRSAPRGAAAMREEMSARNVAAGQKRRSAVVERVEDWVACYGPDGAARRYPASAASTARLLYRAGRPDLAAPFERVAGAERRARTRAEVAA